MNTVQGKYPEQFVGPVQLRCENNTLSFSGKKKWEGKVWLWYALGWVAFYYLTEYLFRSLPKSWYPNDAYVIGLARLLLLMFYWRGDVERWFHRNPADDVVISVGMQEITSISLSPKKLNMIIKSKDVKKLKNGRFIVRASESATLEEIHTSLKNEVKQA